MISKNLLGTLLIAYWIGGCTSYKANIMFTAEESTGADWHKRKSFTIKPGDELNVLVVPLNGERLIVNPDQELLAPFIIRVDEQGFGKIPMQGILHLEGKTLREADSVIKEGLSYYIHDPLVSTEFINKKVTVIGSSQSHVILLPNENIRLTEVLALGGGLSPDSRANNIRIIRGEEYFISNLQSARTRIRNDIFIQPNDVIYIEPGRRGLRDSLRETLPLVSGLTGLLNIAILLITIL